MGYLFLDQYSLLHFAVGVIAYFWNLDFWTAFILHTLFEAFENMPIGIQILNKLFPKDGLFRWPGDKVKADSFINTVGDTLAFILGYLLSKFLDELSNQKGWYFVH